MIKGIIFDLDGTLIDSEKIWSETDRKFLTKHGIEPPADISEIVKTMTIQGSSQYFVDRFKLDMTWQEVSDEIRDMVRDEYFYKIPLKDGVLELLDILDSRKIPYCILTASYTDMAEKCLERLGLDKRIAFLMTEEKNQSSKDNFEIFERAAKKLNLQDVHAGEIICVDDSSHALKAAKTGGFITCGIDNGNNDKNNEFWEYSDIICKNILELKNFLDISDIHFEKIKNNVEVCRSDEHRFGTDAILLADFANPKHKDKVCDLGTGCGIIPLRMYAIYKPKIIYAVDIQENAIEQLELGIRKSKITKEEIIPVLGDIKLLKLLKNKVPFSYFNLVTCNPPYTSKGAGIESGGSSQRTARHEIMCTFEDIAACVSKILLPTGRFCFCMRPTRLAEIIFILKKYNLEPKKIRFVAKNNNSEPWLFLMEAVKGGKSGIRVEPNKII